MLDNIKNYWVIIVAVVSISTAWGENAIKISNLEDAVKSNAETQKQVSGLKEKSAAIDERTQAMQQTQVEQQKMLEQIYSQLLKSKR